MTPHDRGFGNSREDPPTIGRARGQGEIVRLRPASGADLRADQSPDQLGGRAALLAGACGFLYSVSFVIVAGIAPALGGLLSALFLLLGGLFTGAVIATLYPRLTSIDRSVALFAAALGLAGALGAMIHGGYDLANALHPPEKLAADLPNPIDPRGLLTFGAAGLAVLLFAWLMRRDERWPRRLGYLGYALGALLLIVYLGRLVILSASSPVVLVPAALVGFVVNPAWYVALGATLLRSEGSDAEALWP